MKTKKIKYYILAVTIVVLSPIGWLLASSAPSDIVVLNSVMELIKKAYVKEVTDKQLTESALSGMLTSLDPHSSFLTEKEFDEMKTVTKGEFGGIGVEIVVESPGLRVISPIDDTPAFKAGIKPGDMIFAVNDELIANMTPSEAINKMRGVKNSKVKVSILREGTAEPLEFNLSRDTIKANPVKSHLYKDIGYIRIASFSHQTTDAAKKAIAELKKEAGKNKIKGYVLDLRNNPGGILEQSVYVSDLFLNQGVIVSTKGRDGKEQLLFSAKDGDVLNATPLVVLINNGSASASEIVAGALQDHKRAIIVGTKSFGKGSVQSVLSLPGYGAIRLTTALYYTPSGRSIQAEGIVPDIIVEPAKIELLNSKDKKMQFSESTLRNHLVNKTSALNNEKEVGKTKAELWAKLYEQDYQLARAIDILKSMELLKKW
jgi:carboxyl-terminal processing protease